MNNQSKAERKNLDTKGNLSAFRLPEIVCDKGNTDHCVFCGATVPEGRQVCPTCQANDAWIQSKKEGLI